MEIHDELPPPLPQPPERWPQIGGADIELANFMTGIDPALSNMAAARAVLAAFDGVSTAADKVSSTPSGSYDTERTDRVNGADSTESARPTFNPQDWCRKWSAVNGSCAYIDMSHVELAFPEITSAKQFVAYWHAMLLLAMRARESANRNLPSGRQIELVANNSDGHGVSSWGAHLNFCIPRRSFDRILYEKVHYLLFLAGFQASAVIFGQGKVGSENGRPSVDFQLSQRADFIETVSGWQTTYRRPIVNLRDEALCGRSSLSAASQRPADKWARLHVIFHDSTLSHVANFLKFGATQIVLQMIAEGWVDTSLLLDDPLEAVQTWSHDISLTSTAPLLAGGSVTAVEMQLRILAHARRFIDEGRCQVADAQEILELWRDTLLKFQTNDWPALAPRVDWVRKWMLITHAMRRHPHLTWQSPEVKHLDHQWASLNAAGLYWAMDRAGAVEHIVTEREIAQAMIEPPDTRAFARAALLRLARPGQIADVNWDSIAFNVRTPAGRATRTLELPDPHFTRGSFERLTRGCTTLQQMLDALGAPAPVVMAPVSVMTYGRTWRRDDD
jgi:proteasome accessory factor A